MNDSSSSSPNPVFELSLTFLNGWCDLYLEYGDEQLTIRATTLSNAFNDLVDASIDLAQGRQCVSVMWGGEGNGAFVDLALDATEYLGVVVHEMADSNWFSPALRWAPARGHALFTAYVSFSEFARKLGRELRKIRVQHTDITGYMPHWGWSYPQARYELFESLMARRGFKPVSTQTIRHELQVGRLREPNPAHA
ncbi:hypothetical protein [Gandjariella thermophila]|uniref:Uncharacterized protein n=1 Tax=Gandjariella thermophila TaxID=1931992 RepID=A0A4D4JBL0_9PSEU|nr:hypothetical protein [Gandjariella thermophila]GDY32410.1 hypothetical protein GTS_40430 [Gandjariella thermophila]